ncbi:MAG: glucose-1-phosphate adenylyltransferase [Candidatus Delongbacteria bacterium]|nr:glucose-1-phosphate adenylyltransferase [bacterium]MBL7033289.1 glucose-1-phosphate adenylyltransferase [Candidatus Delongbacteria bacterium]
MKIVEHTIQKLKRTSVFILAGGVGQRLFPLTRERSKPAVSFGGKYRIIDFTLSNCLNSGLRRINLVVQYKSHSLDRHLKLGWNVFSSRLGEHITALPPQFYTETWYKGTADAIYQNLFVIKDENPEQVLILSGDHIYKMDYGRMLEFHIERKADLTVACLPLPRDEATRFGVISVDAKQHVTRFNEKPEQPDTIPGDETLSLCSMGVYIFSTRELVRRLIQDAKRSSNHDFGTDIIPEMIEGKKVFAFPFTDDEGQTRYWRDIGTLDAYYDTSIDLINVNPQFDLYSPGWPIYTYQGSHPPAKFVFNQGDRVGVALNSLTSGGVIISGGRVERSILSPRVQVHSQAQVNDSILMDDVDVGRHCLINRAIIDKRVKIPDGVQVGCDLESDRKLFPVTDNGIVVIPSDYHFD